MSLILFAATVSSNVSNIVLIINRTRGTKGRLDVFSAIARLASYLATALRLPRLLTK